MKGGAATGFRHVKPTEYQPRLFQVVGERKNITVKQIPMKKGNVNSDDVFIFDLGLEIYQVGIFLLSSRNLKNICLKYLGVSLDALLENLIHSYGISFSWKMSCLLI